MPEWANVERGTLAWLRARLERPGYTEVPADPPEEYFTVERTGGGGRWLDKDVDVEVSVHAMSRPAMWAFAAAVESAMWALAANGDPQGDPPFYVDDVGETFAFAVDPHPNAERRRATATYTLTVRPQA